MTAISPAAVRELREKTNAGMMACKNALREAKGDMETAVGILRKKGLAIAAKKGGRSAKEGVVGSYIHLAGKIGVLVEVNCETDFVAKNDLFGELVRDLCLHVAAAHPKYVSREEIPADVLAKEKDIYASQISGKPPQVVDKIVAGKLEKFFSDVCLLDQPFVKDGEVKIKDLMTQKIAQIGENLILRRFVRFQVGEEI